MLPSPTPQVVVVNESSKLDTKTLWNTVWSVAYQVKWQFGPLWKIAADFSVLDPGKPVPVDAWILHLLDKIDEPGALGYHDEDGKEVPFGRVGIQTSEEDGISPSGVISHEALELLADPHINLTAFDGKKRLYPLEVCDPAQGGVYDLGAPYGRTTGVLVSDFVRPEYFDPNTAAKTVTSYRGVCVGPFSLGTKGYYSYTETLPPNWQQAYGEQANKSQVDHDDRVARRFTASV